MKTRLSWFQVVPLWLFPSAILAAVFTWAQSTLSWSTLWVAAYPDHPFLDLRQVTFTASCVATDPNWSMASATCDPLGRGYNYPSVWARVFAVLGIGSDDTMWVGVLIAVLVIAAIAAVTALAVGRAMRWRTVVLLSVAVVSPPMLLLLERGNIDGFVLFALVMSIAAAVFAHEKTSAMVLAVATAMKLFPVAAVVMLVADRARAKRWWLPVALFAGWTAVLLLPTLGELSAIRERTPMSQWGSFGSGVIGYFVNVWFGLTLGTTEILAVGLLVAAVGFFVVWAVIRHTPFREPWSALVSAVRGDRAAAMLVLGAGAPFVLTYLLGTNADYRLVFLIPVAAGLSRSASARNPLGVLLAVTLVAGLYLSMPLQVSSVAFHQDLAVVMDVLWIAIVPAVALLVWDVTRQGLPAVRTALVAQEAPAADIPVHRPAIPSREGDTVAHDEP